jgi:hypothetical protein
VRGLAYVPGYVAEGSDADAAQRNLVAHELGHSLGRNHAANSGLQVKTNYITNVVAMVTNVVTSVWKSGRCDEWSPNTAPDFPMLPYGPSLAPVLGPWSPPKEMIFGFDHLQQLVISPSNTFDLMSYCNTGYSKPIPGSTSFPWMSLYTYTNIFNALINRWGGGGAPAPSSLPVGGEFLLVRGMLDETRLAFDLLPLYSLTLNAAPAPPDPGPYLLHLLDASGALLSEIPFTPDFSDSEFDPTSDDPTLPLAGYFTLVVPLVPGLARLEVWHGGQLLVSRNASAHAPAVQIFQPLGGETFGPGQIALQWNASDADADTLSAMVQYSRDNGVTWDTLTLDHEPSSLNLDPALLMASPQARLRVTVSDGFSSARADTGVFTVQNHPPAVTIRAPNPGDVFFGEQTMVLEASAFDFDDGPLSGASVQWQSNRDGQLGVGPMLLRSSSTLSEGTHLLTVTASDSAGLTTTNSVSVQVFRTTPPVLTVATDTAGIVLSWPALLVDYFVQTSTNLSTSTWVTLTNAPVLVGDQWTLGRSIEERVRFYRLIKP